MSGDNRLFDVAPLTTNWRLDERFGMPPFSTLDTRSGTWRNRRAVWLELDMSSTEGRAERLTFVAGGPNRTPTDDVSQKILAVGSTSEFDPLLCEVAIRWWSPGDAVILDPFAGGSVRGIVSGILGREYHGVDLSSDQVFANVRTLDRLRQVVPIDPPPAWHVGDSASYQPDVEADMLFSCPPYGSLEKYSDDPADLSNMKYHDFADSYHRAVHLACDRLKDDRFAVFVVGNYREGDRMRDLVGLTIRSFETAGLIYHADLVLMNSTATAGMRASAQFNGNRKPVMCHQHVVVMCKGDPRRAAAAAERLDPLDVEGDHLSDVQDFPLEDGVRRL